MDILYNIILAIIGFSSGIVVAAGIFAFIAVIGIVPRIAQKTQTIRYIPLYEDAIILGGIWGATTIFVDYHIPVGIPVVVVFSLAMGIFFGCLAVSLAEVLNVMPVFSRRTRLKAGLSAFITGMAAGKLTGSMLYFYINGFFAG